MTPNAKEAFSQLQSRGVPVREWGEAEGYESAQFVLIHASADGNETFADNAGEWIKETWVNDQHVNPGGIRQDVHEILAANELSHEWHNEGQICIYDASDEGNIHSHGYTDQLYRNFRERVRKEKGQDAIVDPPPMSAKAFSAFSQLARIGAPVFDFHSYSHTYDPDTLTAGCQFVMKCEPKMDCLFADAPSALQQFFAETQGLRPDIYAIVQASKLTHAPHTHCYEDARFNPLELIQFFDPQATRQERGVK